MAVTTISRYAFTDDTGDGLSGDVWNASLIGASIYDKIDAILANTITLGGGLAFNTSIGVFAQAAIHKNATHGLVVMGATGATNCVGILDQGGNPVITVPITTVDVNFAGNINPTNSYVGRAGRGGATSNAFNVYWTGSAAQLWIDTTNAGTITLTSDARVKKAIAPLAHGLADILALQPRSFEWATGNEHDPAGPQFGLIAQEVLGVLPEVVHHMPGLASEVAPDGLYRVDYLALVPVLVRAVQELAERLEAAA